MSASEAAHIGVWGATGSGKSSYVKAMARDMSRVVVFDPQAEYATLRRGMKTATTVEGVKVAMLNNWSDFRIVYRPPPGREERALNQLSNLVLLAQRETLERGQGPRLTLIVEELNLSFPVNGADRRVTKFAELCSRGRHSNVQLIGVSQRIAEVSTRFRGNLAANVIFRQEGARDLQAATDLVGGDRAAIRLLDNLDFIHRARGTSTPGKIVYKRGKPYVA